MFVSLRLLTLTSDRLAQRDQMVEALRRAADVLPGVTSSWVAPVLGRAVINAGDIVWRMTFQTEREALAASMAPEWGALVAPTMQGAQVTAAGYRVTRGATRGQGGGIWRALIFRVMPEGFPVAAKQLEDSLLLFPKYVDTIRSWALSQVSIVEGPKAFTHVWEQEFDSIEGLTGEYMTHPIHWGFADAFFDSECPQYMVDPYLIQVVGLIDAPILRIH